MPRQVYRNSPSAKLPPAPAGRTKLLRKLPVLLYTLKVTFGGSAKLLEMLVCTRSTPCPVRVKAK